MGNHFRSPQISAAARHTSFDRVRSRCGAIVTALFLLLVAFAQFRAGAQSSQLSPPRQAAFEATISKFIAANKIPGLSVAIVESRKLVWSNGFGTANLEDNVPATSQTLYRLASVSKSLTATAAMQLWERGKLDLDAPIQKYCPAFPSKPQTVTTRELLGHLGGIRHYKSNSLDDPEIGNTKYFEDPIAAGIKFFADDPLIAAPGTHYHYSTQGYTLVGCAIQGASGQKYVDYMRENIFLPADMGSTQVDDHYAIIPHRSGFYGKDESKAIVNAAALDSSYKIPGGGWLSSADDMARFEIAVLNDRLVKASTAELMWTRQKPSDGGRDDYGLGWDIVERNGVATFGNNGGQQGTSTAIMIAPSSGDGIVVLSNLEGVDATALAADLLKILFATQPQETPAALNH